LGLKKASLKNCGVDLEIIDDVDKAKEDLDMKYRMHEGGFTRLGEVFGALVYEILLVAWNVF
jgi:hypothetical protein